MTNNGRLSYSFPGLASQSKRPRFFWIFSTWRRGVAHYKIRSVFYFDHERRTANGRANYERLPGALLRRFGSSAGYWRANRKSWNHVEDTLLHALLRRPKERFLRCREYQDRTRLDWTK